MDCRLWHCLPPNLTDDERVMINCRYHPRTAPAGTSGDGEFMGARDPMPRSIFDRLPEAAKPLYSHGVVEG